jgi:hypothetical protein
MHIGDLALHQLKLADRFAELPALVNIGQHHVHPGVHDAERAGREHHPLVVKTRHQDRDAVDCSNC